MSSRSDGDGALDWVMSKNQLIYGATSGLAFLTAIEVLDGFSDEWGFLLVIFSKCCGYWIISRSELQEEQRIVLKYSFHQTSYAKIRPETLGRVF